MNIPSLPLRLPVLTLALLPLLEVSASDPWEPWRRDAVAGPKEVSVVVEESKARTCAFWETPKGGLPAGVEPIPAASGSKSEGARFQDQNQAVGMSCPLLKGGEISSGGYNAQEVTFRFRVAQFPKDKMQESWALAQFTLRGQADSFSFYLHAYGKKPGFMINNFSKNPKHPWSSVSVETGVMKASSAAPFDSDWHTIRMVWDARQMLCFWDDSLVFQGSAENQGFDTLIVNFVKPGVFDSVDMTPIRTAPARLPE